MSQGLDKPEDPNLPYWCGGHRHEVPYGTPMRRLPNGIWVCDLPPRPDVLWCHGDTPPCFTQAEGRPEGECVCWSAFRDFPDDLRPFLHPDGRRGGIAR